MNAPEPVRKDEDAVNRATAAFAQLTHAMQSHADAISSRMVKFSREVNASVERNRRRP